MKATRKLGVLMLVSILILTLSGCTKTMVSQIEEVTEYKKIKLEFDAKVIKRKGFTYDAKNVDGINYLEVEDFVALSNYVNEALKWIVPIKLENFSKDNLTLDLQYRNDANYQGNLVAAALGMSSIKKLPTKIDGDNKKVTLELDKLVLKPILIDDNIYLPIDNINFEIFTGNNPLVRIDDNRYEIGSNYYENIDSLVNNQGSVSYTKDYSLSLRVLNEYLAKNYKNYKTVEIKENINSYEEYIIEVINMTNQLKDYHSAVEYNEKNANSETFKEVVNDSFYITSFEGLYAESIKSKEEIVFNKINKDTFYIDIDTFFGDPSSFFIDSSKFFMELKEDKEIKSVIIDLRNNSGGWVNNALLLMDRLVTDQYSYKIGNRYGGEIYSTQEFTLQKENPKSQDKKFIVLVNEYSASASVVATHIIKENLNAEVIGREPLYKKSQYMQFIQLLDGSFVSFSMPNFCIIDDNGNNIDDTNFVDTVMTDEEIGAKFNITQ